MRDAIFAKNHSLQKLSTSKASQMSTTNHSIILSNQEVDLALIIDCGKLCVVSRTALLLRTKMTNLRVDKLSPIFHEVAVT